MLIFPSFFRLEKMLWLVGGALLAVTLACGLMLLKPDLAESMIAILRRMTLDKADSTSGLQRAFWAKQGFSAFQISFGLGIGAGSFRSSNIFTAVLGSMGVIGVSTLLVYLTQILRPLRQSTYSRSAEPLEAVGISASWAAIFALIPAMLAASSPDLGTSFSIFAGAALGLRGMSTRRQQVSLNLRQHLEVRSERAQVTPVAT